MKTKETCFAFEKEARIFFDDYYKKKGWACKRITGKANIKYDCLILTGHKWLKIQEKARSADYGDCLVEIIQDVKTGSKGWLYTCEADFILYKTPDNFYWIDKKKLEDFVKINGADFDIRESMAGWGRTINIIIPWRRLEERRIAAKISI